MFLIAILYLIIPVFIILFTFFSTPFVVPSAAALIILVFCLYRTYHSESGWQLKSLLRYWPLLLVSLIVTYSCVYPFDSVDWRNYLAAFNLLAESTWTPVYEYNGHTWFLRYYIPPALVTKVIGGQFLMHSMFIWTAAGLILAMLLAFRNLHKKHLLIIAPLVFFLFSGLDIVGAWLVGMTELPNPYYLNWWGGQWLFEIFANLNAFSYSPHHAIATFLPVSLFLFKRRLAVQYGGLLLTVNTMWSTFGTVGLLPIAAWALYREGWRTALTPQNLLSAPMLAIPIVLYLTQGASHVPSMFSWEDINFSFSFFVLFCILEFLLILTILYWFQKEDRTLIATLAIFLTILCMFKVGGYNNLLYRGAMPAVCVMALLMFKAILANRGWRRDALLSYLLIGTVPVLLAFTARIKVPKVDRWITIQEHYDMRTIQDREAERWQYLVYTDYAVHVLGIPLLRGLP